MDSLQYIKHLYFLSQWFPQEFHKEGEKLQKQGLAGEAIDALEHLRDYGKLQTYLPYGLPQTLEIEGWSKKPWQLDFHNLGADYKERMLICANGVGKSISGAYETAIHLTGLYPEWWEGYRFRRPPKFWVGSITNEIQRDYIQPLLLGPDLFSGLGQGFIPKERILGKIGTRQCGISGVADTVKIRHESGGTSTVQFKTYEQGWRKWQASAPDGIWLDEEPDEHVSDQKDIFTEVQTRLVRTSGILYVTFTPLLGMTALADHFLNPKINGIIAVTATWDDAPHLKAEDKERLIATYPEWQVEARTKGVPMMGEGRVFTTPEDEIKVEPFEIPHYFAQIKGIDFGIDHPAAVVDVAWDRDKDILYITRARKQRNMDSEEHADLINAKDSWVPVSWPHDGTNREKRNGERLKDAYVKHGVKLLSQSARYKSETGGSQPVEPIILEMQERFRAGSLKVFSSENAFFDEYRNYHRKDGKLSKVRDDILKAAMYAIMMKRYAATNHKPRIDTAQMAPIVRL